MSTETKVLTTHVPLGLAEKVEAMAARLERSRGWVMKPVSYTHLTLPTNREV